MCLSGSFSTSCLVLMASTFAMPSPMIAQTIDADWTVTAFSGEALFVDPQKVIGTVQSFNGGYSEGPFYACNFGGQSMGYTTYDMVEFINSRAFELFLPAHAEISQTGSKVFVHRISCNGDDDPLSRRALYPFITVDDAPIAWYPFEEGVFKMEIKR